MRRGEGRSTTALPLLTLFTLSRAQSVFELTEDDKLCPALGKWPIPKGIVTAVADKLSGYRENWTSGRQVVGGLGDVN